MFINEEISENDIIIDIETAKRDFLPITISSTDEKDIIIRKIFEPMKIKVAFKSLVQPNPYTGVKEVIQNNPPSIELNLCCNILPFYEPIQSVLYFKDDSIIKPIRGFIKDLKHSFDYDGSKSMMTYLGIMDVTLARKEIKMEPEEKIKEVVRKINRRFHFD